MYSKSFNLLLFFMEIITMWKVKCQRKFFIIFGNVTLIYILEGKIKSLSQFSRQVLDPNKIGRSWFSLQRVAKIKWSVFLNLDSRMRNYVRGEGDGGIRWKKGKGFAKNIYAQAIDTDSSVMMARGKGWWGMSGGRLRGWMGTAVLKKKKNMFNLIRSNIWW